MLKAVWACMLHGMQQTCVKTKYIPHQWSWEAWYWWQGQLDDIDGKANVMILMARPTWWYWCQGQRDDIDAKANVIRDMFAHTDQRSCFQLFNSHALDLFADTDNRHCSRHRNTTGMPPSNTQVTQTQTHNTTQHLSQQTWNTHSNCIRLKDTRNLTSKHTAPTCNSNTQMLLAETHNSVPLLLRHLQDQEGVRGTYHYISKQSPGIRPGFVVPIMWNHPIKTMNAGRIFGYYFEMSISQSHAAAACLSFVGRVACSCCVCFS